MNAETLLKNIVTAIVDNPEAIQITRKTDQMGVMLTLTVHKDDMGKVVGRGGQTAGAIRILLRVAGVKEQARVALKIMEPEGGTHPERRQESDREMLGL